MINVIEDALAQILAGVAGVKKVIRHPINDLGRELPAIILLYAGFDQRLTTAETGRITLKWKATIVWPLDARTAQGSWDQVKTLVPAIFTALRNNATLSGLCHGVLVEAGEPTISTGEVQYVGHSFNISVWRIGAINLMRDKLGVAEPTIGRVYPSGNVG